MASRAWAACGSRWAARKTPYEICCKLVAGGMAVLVSGGAPGTRSNSYPTSVDAALGSAHRQNAGNVEGVTATGGSAQPLDGDLLQQQRPRMPVVSRAATSWRRR